MPSKNLALIVLATLSLWGCSILPSAKQTVKTAPPVDCVSRCDPLPEPLDGSELSIRRWEYQAVETFGECRRMQAACGDWVLQR